MCQHKFLLLQVCSEVNEFLRKKQIQKLCKFPRFLKVLRSEGVNEKLYWGTFVFGGGNLRRSGFDHSNLFQS